MRHFWAARERCDRGPFERLSIAGLRHRCGTHWDRRLRPTVSSERLGGHFAMRRIWALLDPNWRGQIERNGGNAIQWNASQEATRRVRAWAKYTAQIGMWAIFPHTHYVHRLGNRGNVLWGESKKKTRCTPLWDWIGEYDHFRVYTLHR